MDNGVKWMREVGKLDLKLWEKDWLWYENDNDTDQSGLLLLFECRNWCRLRESDCLIKTKLRATIKYSTGSDFCPVL